MSAIKLPDLEPRGLHVSSLLATSPSLPPSQAEQDSFTLGSAARCPGWVPHPPTPPQQPSLSQSREGARTTQHSPSLLWSSFLPSPKGDSAWLGSAPTWAGRMCPRAAATSRALILSHHQPPSWGGGTLARQTSHVPIQGSWGKKGQARLFPTPPSPP